MFLVRIRRALINLLGGARVDREIDEELRAAYESMVDARIAKGVPPADARRLSCLEFGGMAQVKESVRDVRAGAVVTSFVRDTGYALRGFRRYPGFVLTVVLTLALAGGAATTVFTMLNGMVLRPLPFPDAEQIVAIGTVNAAGRNGNVSYLDWQDWRAATSSLSELAAYARTTFTLSDADLAPEPISGLYGGAELFRLLGIRPALGRTIDADDDIAGAAPVVLLSDDIWHARYAADPSVVGRTVRINDISTTVIGIMPRGFKFDWNAQAWLPLRQMDSVSSKKRDARTLLGIGRLRPAIRPAAAQAELNNIAGRLARQYPETNHEIRASVVPFNARMVGAITDPIYFTLLIGLTCVLLIGVANVANLVLARAMQRDREIATKVALGASRGRVIRQFLIENALLVLPALGIGLAVSVLALRAIADPLAGNMPYWVRMTLDVRVFLFVAFVVILFVATLSLWPARVLVRQRVQAFSRSGNSGEHFGGWRWTHWFLIGQFALTLTLLAGASVSAKKFLTLYRLDAPIAAAQIATIRLVLPMSRYPSGDARLALHERLNSALAGEPQLEASALSTALPFTPIGVVSRKVGLDGQPASGLRPLQFASVLIGERYFDVLGLRLLNGREFNDRDGQVGNETIIINRMLAEQLFPGGDAMGKKLTIAADAASDIFIVVTIVGIAPTIRQSQQDPLPVIYLPYRWQPTAATYLFVRSARIQQAIPEVRRIIHGLDPELALGVMSLETVLRQGRLPVTMVATLFVGLGFLGLLFSVVGFYAVMSCAVNQRTTELGIRRALGATWPLMVWLVLRRALAQMGAGALLGLAGAWTVVRLLQVSLGDTGRVDWWLLTGVAFTLLAAGLLACAVPVRRATQCDALTALRTS